MAKAAAVKKKADTQPEGAQSNSAANDDTIDKAKQDILALLKESGIEADPKKSTSELIGYLRKNIKELEDKAVSVEMSVIDGIVVRMKANTNLQNEEFLRRLATLGVLPLYVQPYRQPGQQYDVHLFRDQDMELDDEAIWKKILHSGIEPVSRFSLFKQRFEK